MNYGRIGDVECTAWARSTSSDAVAGANRYLNSGKAFGQYTEVINGKTYRFTIGGREINPQYSRNVEAEVCVSAPAPTPNPGGGGTTPPALPRSNGGGGAQPVSIVTNPTTQESSPMIPLAIGALAIVTGVGLAYVVSKKKAQFQQPAFAPRRTVRRRRRR